MILLTAILLGLLSGMARAELEKHRYQTLELNKPGLVLLAFLVQLCIFQLPRLGFTLKDGWSAIALIISQVTLVVFSLINLKNPGFYLLAIGTLLNIVVMVINGGWMPMTPETISNLYPQANPQSWTVGEHLWNSKNIVLEEEMTRLSFLSDRMIIPEWSPYRVAFSLGDVIMATGAFWLFWSLGGRRRKHKEIINEQNEYNRSTIRTDWRRSHREGIQPDSYRRSH
jgi:Family of unknown function (DUF5317)